MFISVKLLSSSLASGKESVSVNPDALCFHTQVKREKVSNLSL